MAELIPTRMPAIVEVPKDGDEQMLKRRGLVAYNSMRLYEARRIAEGRIDENGDLRMPNVDDIGRGDDHGEDE